MFHYPPVLFVNCIYCIVMYLLDWIVFTVYPLYCIVYFPKTKFKKIKKDVLRMLYVLQSINIPTLMRKLSILGGKLHFTI